MRTTSALFSSFFALSVTAMSALSGCTADAIEGDSSDETEVAEDAVTGDPSNFGYFVVTRRDFRRCAAPLCGGFFVKRVNEEKTTCADGSKASECYVGAVELKGIGLSQREEAALLTSIEEGRTLLKARTYRKTTNGVVIGTLKANEAWRGATGSKALGTFYRAGDSGIRCIKAPCPSLRVQALNGRDSQNLIGVSFENTSEPADQHTIDRATSALHSRDGVLIAGSVLLPKCVAGAFDCGPKAIASEFFLRVTHTEGLACGVRGVGDVCNDGQYCAWAAGDLCGAADAPGHCSFRSEMCPQVYMPVCGCDGKTYGNACSASSAGASILSNGECEPEPTGTR